MGLTRKFLSALGVDADKIDEIISAHTETINALREERDTFKADAEKLPGVQAELDKYKTAAEKDKPFETQYNDLKAEYEKYKADISAKETKSAKESAYRALLKEAGIADKRIDAVMRVADLGSFELDKDGKIKDSDKMKETIKTEWSDFITTSGQQGASTATPPGGNNGGAGGNLSRAAELAAKYQANLYGKAKEDK